MSDVRPSAGHNLPGASLRLEYRDIVSLRPATRPVRRVTRQQAASIAASIDAHGFCAPVLIRDDGEVVDGHARLQAARSVSLEQVPCIIIDHLTEIQVRSLRLALNRLQEKGEWDLDALKLEFEDMLDLGVSLEATGFKIAEVDLVLLGEGDGADADGLDPEANSVPDTKTSPTSRDGDRWFLGRQKILCGNAVQEAAYAALMDQELAAGVFTDPPFNMPVRGHVCGSGAIHHPEFVMASGEMSPEDFHAFLLKFLRCTAFVTADGGILYLCMDWRHVQELLAAIDGPGLDLLNLCVWVKDNAGMGSLYRSQHELVVVVKKGKAAHMNNVQLGKFGRNRSNVWRYPGVNSLHPERRKELRLHPTVKPCEMIADAILDSTRPGDIVLDPFLGSGTTVIACEKTGRVCRAMELDPRYVDVAIERRQDYTGEAAVLQETGLTFDQVRDARLGEGPSRDALRRKSRRSRRRIMAHREPRARRRADLDAHLRASGEDGPDPPTSEDAESYAVGYGKPPRHTQFKPGQSGNPRGRPKAPTAFDDLIEKELSQLVTVREGDQSRRLPKRTVIVKQVVKKAMEGEDRALRSLLTLIGAAKSEKQKAAATVEADPDAPLTKIERSILAEFEAQLREKILQEQEHGAKQSASMTAKPLKENET